MHLFFRSRFEKPLARLVTFSLQNHPENVPTTITLHKLSLCMIAYPVSNNLQDPYSTYWNIICYDLYIKQEKEKPKICTYTWVSPLMPVTWPIKSWVSHVKALVGWMCELNRGYKLNGEAFVSLEATEWIMALTDYFNSQLCSTPSEWNRLWNRTDLLHKRCAWWNLSHTQKAGAFVVVIMRHIPYY